MQKGAIPWELKEPPWLRGCSAASGNVLLPASLLHPCLYPGFSTLQGNQHQSGQQLAFHSEDESRVLLHTACDPQASPLEEPSSSTST